MCDRMMGKAMELLFDCFLIFIECSSLYYISNYMPMWHMPGHGFHEERYSYPYVSDTVTKTFLVRASFIVPISSFFIFEIFTKRSPLKSKIFCFLNQITKFACGILLMLIFGVVLKHVTGVPRPYYNTVCRPNINTNRDEVSRYPYILNDKDLCENPDYHEAIRSFPSLHAAAVFYNCVYLSCYYESRWTLKNFVLLKPMLQGALFLGAIFTSSSRITHFKHHLTDVIVGSLLGVVFAIFLMLSATDIFKASSNIPKTKVEQNEKID